MSLPVQLGDIDFGPALDISRDGSELVFIGRSADGRPGLFHRGLAEREPALIAQTQGALVRSPTLSPDGQMVAFTSQSQLRVAALRGGSDRIVVDSVSPTSGGLDWGPNDSIVFQRSFGEGLMLVSASGGKPRVLTRVDSGNTADHRWPQILPDGKSVIFTVWDGASRSARLAIASVRTGKIRDLLPGMFGRYTGDGHLLYIGPNQTLQRVAFNPGTGRIKGESVALDDSVLVNGDGAAQFAISETGTLAYLPSIGRRVPVVVDRRGVATPLKGLSADLYMTPRYSPNGRLFAMEQSNGDIWAYDMAAETFSRITDGGGFYPVWTRDGSRILYSRDEQAEVNVYSVPLNRSESRRTVLVHHGQQRTQDLSHDGKHLLLRENLGTGQYDLLAMALNDTASPKPWLATEFLERAPAFSPNDRWVAYSSDETGRDEIYVRPFPGPGGRIPVSSGGGTEPAWSPDGKELYFRTTDGLQAVSVESGTAFRVLSRPQTLFDEHYYAYAWARQYDVHPDGRHFLFLRNDTQVIDLTVIVNWSQSLRERSPTR